MIAWWIRAGCLLFGETGLGIRLPIILSFALTQTFLYLLARDIVGWRAGLIAVFLSGITPMALAGGFIATYDPLVVAFWAAALYYFSRAVLFEDRAAWWRLGISFGLGLLAKHTMILLAPCLLAFLSTSRRSVWLKRPQPYLAFALGLGMFVPNLLWQADHQWMTFGHLFNLSGKGLDHPFLRRFGDFLGSQIALISPLLFFGYVGGLAAWRHGRDNHSGDGLRLLLCASVPILVLFLVMTAKSKVQANWAITGWITPPILFAAWVQAGSSKRQIFALLSAGLCVMLSLLLVFPEARTSLGIRIPHRWDQMNKLYGGRELGLAIAAEKRAMGSETGRPVKVGSTTYDSTSRISFYTPGKPEACNLFLGTRPNSYLLWNENDCPSPGDDMILSDGHPPGVPGRPPYESIFERVLPANTPIAVYRRGVYREPILTYYLYRCYNYTPNPAVELPSGRVPVSAQDP